MKKIGLLIALFISLASCSNDDSTDKLKLATNDYYGKWVSIQNEASWNDEYVFSTDGTFTRKKTVNSITTNLSGTFEIFEREGRANFQLTYSAPSDLIFSCGSGFGGKSELLYILNGNLENSGRMCDYQLTYKKAK
ncbi:MULTISPECIES: hypothetical protein [Flavobacterium]|uniref:hypothetical protein n=1 Tax=Flavobacterium TaxID=237 RepID=UPI001182A6E4|nr:MULTISPECIES: hypothetical protein [Flavobacterium]MCR4029442.1 hypothetical protein [Flavobacterium panacis]